MYMCIVSNTFRIGKVRIEYVSIFFTIEIFKFPIKTESYNELQYCLLNLI